MCNLGKHALFRFSKIGMLKRTCFYCDLGLNYFINVIFFSSLDSDWLKSVPINP